MPLAVQMQVQAVRVQQLQTAELGAWLVATLPLEQLVLTETPPVVRAERQESLEVPLGKRSASWGDQEL